VREKNKDYRGTGGKKKKKKKKQKKKKKKKHLMGITWIKGLHGLRN